jgi:tripartite-type tricarboxylate transporter receptor subunit TctC
VPAKTLPELIAYLKTKPGELNYATYGNGSGPHLAGELFQAATGTRIVPVPYPSGGAGAVAVMSNQVQIFLSGSLPVLGMIRQGQLRALAYASDKRSSLLPDVPTFKEQGFDIRSGTWFGLLAPGKTPEPIVTMLHKAAAEIMQEPELRDKLSEQGAEIVANTPGEFRAFIKDETERLSVIIRNANIRLD